MLGTTVLLCLLGASQIALGAWPFGSDFVYWFWQSSVVAGNWLYIDGGEYHLLDNGIPSGIRNAKTFSIDLSHSWTIETVNARNISKPPAMATARRPPLWYDPQSNLVMERGGWSYTANASLFVWSFTPDGNGGANWSLDQSSSAAQQLPGTFGGAFTSSGAGFYSLGGAVPGVLNRAYDPHGFAASEGLITYDFASSTWQNTSSSSSSQPGYFVQSQAVAMPDFGKTGLLAFLGGDSPPNQTYLYEAGAALVDMSNITIYDIDSDIWYHQTATGDVPPPRSEFCAVGSAPTDNSSYEVYVFGGSTNTTVDVANAEDTGYLDVYILSMPAFTWFKAGALTESRRSNHFCQVIGQSQMLVIGGRDPAHNVASDGGFWPNGADPWTRGMRIFDMATWKWTNSYDANATPYEQPLLVQTYYANHVNKTQWNDPALAGLFTPRFSPFTGNSTTSPSSPSPSSTHHSNIGSIVGGIVGGIAGLVAISLVAFYFVHRHRRQKGFGLAGSIHEMPHEQKYEMPHEQKYERRHEQKYERRHEQKYERRHEQKYEMPHEQKYEMASPTTELPGEAGRISSHNSTPPYAHELQDTSKDHDHTQNLDSHA